MAWKTEIDLVNWLTVQPREARSIALKRGFASVRKTEIDPVAKRRFLTRLGSLQAHGSCRSAPLAPAELAKHICIGPAISSTRPSLVGPRSSVMDPQVLLRCDARMETHRRPSPVSCHRHR